MLKYQANGMVSYFTYSGNEYRRIESDWEIKADASWDAVSDSDYLHHLESLHQKRQFVFDLINEVDRLKQYAHNRTNDVTNKYTNAVRKLMDIFGVRVMIEYDKNKLMKLLNEGNINLASI